MLTKHKSVFSKYLESLFVISFIPTHAHFYLL